MQGIAPRLLEVPKSLAHTSNPKIIDFTEIDVYPSRYKYENGIVRIKSLIIEPVERQHEVFKKLNTTVYLGDIIKIDIKFGHLVNNEWIDLYYKGLLKVKQIRPLAATGEILMLVSESLK
jgi:hypothetical protein